MTRQKQSCTMETENFKNNPEDRRSENKEVLEVEE
jgi:hypothetical protein